MSKTGLTWGIVGVSCASLVAAAVMMPVGGNTRPRIQPANVADNSTEKPQTPPPAVEPDSPVPVPSEPPLLVKEPAATPDGMVWVPGGVFRMGADPPPADNPDRIKADEVPAHEVRSMATGWTRRKSPIASSMSSSA